MGPVALIEWPWLLLSALYRIPSKDPLSLGLSPKLHESERSMRSKTEPLSIALQHVALVTVVILALVTRTSVATAQTMPDTTATNRCVTPNTTCAPQSVSMIQLIANPERFDGKRVKLIGFVHFEFEESAVYLHREDFEHGLVFNRLGADLRAEVGKGHGAINDHYVLLEGTFRADGGGMSSGALVDITSADISGSRDVKHRGGPTGFKVLKGKPTAAAPTSR